MLWRGVFSVKGLSVLITMQGIFYTINSTIQLYDREMLKFAKQQLNYKLNFIGIIVGIWLIFTGISLFYKKKYAYYSTIIVYFLLIIYGIIALVYLLTIEGFVLVPAIFTFTIIIFFLFIIWYIKKNKSQFL